MIEWDIVDVHENPTSLARPGFYLRPPLVIRAWSYIHRICLKNPALKPDQPEAFSHRMQQVDCRAHRHRFHVFIIKALFSYLKTKWMCPNLSGDCQNVFTLCHLRDRLSSWIVQQSNGPIGSPPSVGAALKRACCLADIELRRGRRFLTMAVTTSDDDC
jgi:hypothetical protein